MKTNVLMVCLGNICRSPLAEGLLASKVNPEKVRVDSAGTSNYHIGEPPDLRSIEVAKKYGIDISHQKGRQFTASDFNDFDYIFAMDSSNYHDILQLARDEKDRQKVSLILDQIDIAIKDVPDPYYGGKDGFEKVYEMLDKATQVIAYRIN